FLNALIIYVIIGVSVGLTAYGWVKAQHGTEVVEITIPFDHLPSDLEGFRIAQISDLHVGPTIKHDFVRSMVDRVNTLDADLVVFTGDLANDKVSYLIADIAPLANLKSRYGNYFITGNHEYYTGVESWLRETHNLGFINLLNDFRVIEHKSSRLVLGGVVDFDHSAGQVDKRYRSDPAASLAGAPIADLKILLAHQPINIFEASRVGYDLQLSGHTHGGQYYPWAWVVKQFHPALQFQRQFLSGLHLVGKTWLYVNEGTGYFGPPLRLGTRSEITLIRLTQAKTPFK
ncbi:metallophosphoesterase, partial [bacterium]|nr:metallophosphoesterase [bacterium]